MCRNIKTLFNFEPPVTDDEIRASAIQFVLKLSGFTRPSKANEDAFNLAVEETTAAARKLLASLALECPAWRTPARWVGERDAVLAVTRDQGLEGAGSTSGATGVVLD